MKRWMRQPMARLQAARDLLRLVGEVAWIAAWSLALGAWLDLPGPLLGLPAIAAVAGLSALITRLSTGPRHALLLLGLVALGLGAAGLFAYAALPRGLDWPVARELLRSTPLGLRPPAVVVLTLVGWWRGIAVGRARPTLESGMKGIRVGVVALAALFVVLALLGQATSLSGSLVPPTLLFVCSTLLVIPLANVVEVSEGAAAGGGTDLAPSGPWLATLLSVVGALVLVILILAGTVGLAGFRYLLGLLLQLLGLVVLTVFQIVGSLMFLLMGWLIDAAEAVTPAGRPLPGAERAANLLEELRSVAEEPPAREATAWGQALEILLPILGIVGLVALVAWVLTRGVNRLRIAQAADGVEEVRDSVWSWSALELSREGLLRLRWPHLRRGSPRGPEDGPRLENVYELYEAFLTLGAEVGRPHHPAETPLEYEGRLRASDGSPAGEPAPGGAEVRSITGSYVQARYGPPPARRIDRARLGALAEALGRLRALWRQSA